MKRIILLFLFLFLISCSGVEESVVELVKDSGSVSVYFCPTDDCARELVDFIDSATQTIDCAFFELGLEAIREKLLEKRKGGVSVRVIVDDRYLEKFEHPFVKTDRWGYMHNKFCVVDGVKISSGSMNPTDNGAYKNNNNLLFIESKVLAANYLAEFEEMWEGMFKDGDRVVNSKVDLSGILIENYFCPEDFCAERIKEELSKANESIHFMTFSFTHNGIVNTLLLKNLEGVLVKGVFENRGSGTDYSKFKVLEYQADVVKDVNPKTMHHKVFIIDNEIVITGSMNPTKSGDSGNDENILVIHDAGIASLYLAEFEKVYGESTE